MNYVRAHYVPYPSVDGQKIGILSNKLNDCRPTRFKKKHYSEEKFRHSAMSSPTPKDWTNRIIFVLLIAFIGWQLFRVGLIVGVANGWL